MALITCPECLKEISDQASACPFCGYPLNPPEEAGKSKKSTFLSRITGLEKKRWIQGGCLAILVILSIFVGVQTHQKNEIEKEAAQAFALEQSYHEEVVSILNDMVRNSHTAESLLNLTAKVWQNAIQEEPDPETDPYTKTQYGFYVSDFNTALINLYSDEKTKEKTTQLKDSKDRLNTAIKSLGETPEAYEKVYDELIELHSAYQAVIDLAINPTGSLYTFNTNRRDKIDKFNELRLKVETLLPDLTETQEK